MKPAVDLPLMEVGQMLNARYRAPPPNIRYTKGPSYW